MSLHFCASVPALRASPGHGRDGHPEGPRRGARAGGLREPLDVRSRAARPSVRVHVVLQREACGDRCVFADTFYSAGALSVVVETLVRLQYIAYT